MRILLFSIAPLLIALATPLALAQSPPGWRFTPEQAVSLDRSVRHGGAASALLRGTGGVISLRQSIQPDDYRGRRVRYSAWVKADSLDEDAVLWMRVDGAVPFEAVAFDNMVERPVTGTVDWRRYEIVLDVPAAAQFVIFGIIMSGRGRVWIDDARLEIVGTDVPTTGKSEAVLAEMAAGHAPLSPANLEAALAARRASPRAPVNLDFEQPPPDA